VACSHAWSGLAVGILPQISATPGHAGLPRIPTTRPLKIKAAGMAGDVDDLADEIQPRDPPGLEGFRRGRVDANVR
jgi:hypothetical protein